MEITREVRKQIIAFAMEFTGIADEAITFHKFANRPGYMLVVETRNVEGFIRFLEWMDSEIERQDIEIIRTLPEVESPFSDFERKGLEYFHCLHSDFKVAVEVDNGRIASMIKDEEEEHAI
ncbi:hypothetical protein LYSBPC_06430 [Lysinibacillus piscis]|uniref:Uncharacterized protein n=2 Tax=Lysinibacillus piscis TaxID=2518931 RepID=A0ABQ5NHH4_9BACI|nr:hypothetical protein LYSBPC_06430 [Lysinibacillus sp. KH24]